MEAPRLDENTWPEIRRIKAAGNTGWRYFENLVKTMDKFLGEEKTCEILAAFMAENARRFVLPGMKAFGLEGKDPWSLASYFKLATGDIIGYKIELIQESPRKVRYRLYPPCLWFPKLDIPPSFCRAMGSFEEEAARLVNPRIKIKGEKLMTAGDPYCELIFEEEG